jgi:choline-sulfatase
MLRGDRFKYSIYSKGENREMLLDMTADPGELNNLASNPDWNTVLHEQREILMDWMRRKEDPFLKKWMASMNERQAVKGKL